MKLDLESSPTVSTGIEDDFEFGIAENEVAFDAWSNKLYTRKERAIVRELSCNAWDAHVAAGCADRPFEIHLPTQHEPYFSINDYGTGLSHEDMRMLFSLYFGSSKRNSNKFIGALGLGSKSPFAYKGNGGAYTVISRKDGMTRMYAASKRNGKPHMEQHGTPIETPNAPNGVEIKFAVDSKDIWTWENEAKVALEFITPTPITNIEGFSPKRQEYALRGSTWGLRKVAHTEFGYQVRAIMGNVQYQIGDIDRSLVKNDAQAKILGMPIDMFFPLGALDFALSREALELTDKTIAAVLGMCENVFDEIVKTVREKIDAAPTLWQAQVMLYSLVNSTSESVGGAATMGKLIEQARKQGKLYGKYKNFDFDERSATVNALLYDNVHVQVFEHKATTSKRAKKDILFRLNAPDLGDFRRKSKIDKALAQSFLHEIKVDPKTLFIINDTKMSGDKYIHYFLQESSDQAGIKTVYVINRNQKSVTPEEAVGEAKKLIAEIGDPSYRLMSELTIRYAHLTHRRDASGGSGLGHGRNLVVFKNSLGYRQRSTQKGWKTAWLDATDEQRLATPKFYVVIDKLVATDARFPDAWDMSKFIDLVRSSGKFGLGSAPVFGVRRNSKILQNNTGEYVELMNHVFTKVRKYMTPTKTAALSLHIKPFYDEVKDMLEFVAEEQPLTGSPFQQFACALAEAGAVREANWSEFKKVLDFCESRGKYSPGTVVDFNAKFKTVKALYPMLDFVNGYNTPKQRREKILDYIKLVDEKNQQDALMTRGAAN